MGSPVTEKVSQDGLNVKLIFGSSSMQGWRLFQEDAHNCWANFGKNSSFFAVYDGHCGAEVALYCASKLPDFLKSTEAYQKGNFEQALIDAFIGFDATLTDVAVVLELDKLSINVANESETSDSDSDGMTEQDGVGVGDGMATIVDTSKKISDANQPSQILCPDADSSLDIDDVGELHALDISSDDNEADDEDSLDEADDEDSLDEDGSDDMVNGFLVNMIDKPGYVSGCTAVVALLVDRELFVANVGDSRCVICRNGKTVDMSIDHKPENDEETLRITKAGGRVTKDGRVNGGLNLSRAIGDHAYKMNEHLKPEEQMISAMPDVRKITLANDDEFMVLASDGIWNCMSSEEVVQFVRKRLSERREKVSSICEELFNKCLEPNADGDVIGCDNMTAIIVQFKQNLQQTDDQAPAKTVKRVISPSFVSTDDGIHKRLKIEDDADNV